MNNKRGFTLVELLAVIVIMGLLVVIAIPSINSVSQKTKQKMCNTKLELAQQNLILWAQDNKKCFVSEEPDCLEMNCTGSETRTCSVKFEKLASYGLIEYDNDNQVINPINKANIGDETITIEYNNNNRAFEIIGSTLSCK